MGSTATDPDHASMWDEAGAKPRAEVAARCLHNCLHHGTKAIVGLSGFYDGRTERGTWTAYADPPGMKSFAVRPKRGKGPDRKFHTHTLLPKQEFATPQELLDALWDLTR